MRQLALLIFCTSFALAGTHRHVDPSVSGSSGSGTTGSPWSLTYALSGAGGVIQNGDTVYCNQGTYLNPTNGIWQDQADRDGYPAFVVSVSTGTSGHPVIFRSYQGQSVVWDAQSTFGVDAVRFMTPHVWIWGIEIMSSIGIRNTTHNTLGDWSYPDPTEVQIGPGTNFYPGATEDIKVINCIIHDLQDGYGNTNWSSCVDAECYGTLIFNNGWTAPDRHHGHNVYIQNTTGSTRKLTQCVIWGASENNVQAYGSNDNGQLVVRDMTFTDNIIFQSGSDGGNFLLGGGGVAANNNTVTNNSMYENTDAVNVFNLGWVPYGGGMSNLTFSNNYVGGKYIQFQAPFTGTSGSGNIVWYDASEGSIPSGFQGTTTTKPTTNVVKIYPNAYEAKRANIAIFNWQLSSSVSVDFSSFLSNGDTYYVTDAQNPSVTLASGTYSAPVSIPCTGLSAVQPIGNSGQTRTHTAPEFLAVIVTSTTPGSVSAPGAPTSSAATNVTSNSFTANWSTVSGASGYKVDVATDAGFTSPVSGYNNLDVGNATPLQVTGLTASTTYYYQVKAYNAGGTSGNSNTILVTTGSGTSIPPAPTARPATNIAPNSFTANWQSSGSATGFYGPGINSDELANTIIGGPSANTTTFSFKSKHTGTLTAIRWYLYGGGGYGAGTGGIMTVSLQTDNPSGGHHPSGTTLASSSLTNAISQPLFPLQTFPSPATITAGTIYHLVFTNTDADPVNNYVSNNSIFMYAGLTPQQPTMANDDWFQLFQDNTSGGVWSLRGSGAGQSFTPILELDYGDGFSTGVGYMESWIGRPKTVSGTSGVRETFTVSGEDRTVSTAYIRLRKLSGTDALTVQLQTSGGTVLASASVAAASISTSYSWVTFALSQPIVLSVGSTYNLALSCAGTSSYDLFPIREGSGYSFSSTTYFPDGYAQFNPSGAGWIGWDQWGGSDERDGDLQFYFVGSGGVTGYRLDVATDVGFGNMVSGYNDLDVGNVLFYFVTGLQTSTNYYYQVRSYNGSGVSGNSNITSLHTPSPAPVSGWKLLIKP